MKIIINDNFEIANVGSLTERAMEIDKRMIPAISFTINDGTIPVGTIEAMLADINTVKVVRTDLNGEQQEAVFTEYTEINKVERKVRDESDITTIVLVRANNI